MLVDANVHVIDLHRLGPGCSGLAVIVEEHGATRYMRGGEGFGFSSTHF